MLRLSAGAGHKLCLWKGWRREPARQARQGSNHGRLLRDGLGLRTRLRSIVEVLS